MKKDDDEDRRRTLEYHREEDAPQLRKAAPPRQFTEEISTEELKEMIEAAQPLDEKVTLPHLSGKPSSKGEHFVVVLSKSTIARLKSVAETNIAGMTEEELVKRFIWEGLERIQKDR